MEKVVTITNKSTGHSTTVTEKAWKNGARFYTGYTLVEKQVKEVLKETPDIKPEKKKAITNPTAIERKSFEDVFENAVKREPDPFKDVVKKIADAPLFPQEIKPKRKRKKKDESE
jgi:hypothetical protein